MHINAKRMQRRIEKSAQAPGAGLKFYGSPNLITDADIISDPAEMPLYMFVDDYRSRAAMLGVTIAEAADKSTGKPLYTIFGGCMLDLEMPPATYSSIEELTAAINDLWEIETEPEAEYYTDSAGRLHERIIYPELDY